MTSRPSWQPAATRWRIGADWVADIREQILPLEAEPARRTPYGDLYTIRGPLRGPSGRLLHISVWIIERAGVTRLVIVYPDSHRRDQ